MPVVGSVINWGLANLTAPVSGTTHSVKIVANLNNETVTVPLASLAQVIGDFAAQAMTVDNTQGTATVIVSETVYGWSRTINAGTAQTFQFPGVPNPVFTLTTTGAVSGLVWSLYDWPTFPDAWTNNGNSALASDVNIVNQPIAVDGTVSIAPAQANYAAGAVHAVAVGGTAVVVFPAASITKQAVIKNPSSATESLFIDFVNAAQVAEPGTNGTTFELVPGASYSFGPGAVPTHDVTANAATNGHAFVAVSA